MSIEAAFDGRLGTTPTWRTSGGGKRYLSLSLAVGRGDELEWVSVAVFDKVAAEAPADLVKGERVYCEGKLTVWRRQGADGFKATLSVVASKIVVLDRIGGRRRPTRVRKEGNSEPGAAVVVCGARSREIRRARYSYKPMSRGAWSSKNLRTYRLCCKPHAVRMRTER